MCFFAKRLTGFLLLCALFYRPAVSAEFRVATNSVELIGPVEQGDFEKLKTAVGRAAGCSGSTCSNGADGIDLSLISNGGSFLEGLKIAEYVADQGIRTTVPQNAGCYSACAFIFLAGQYDDSHETGVKTPNRKLFETSKLGLHAPYLEIGDKEYSKDVVEEAYKLAVRHISEIVRLAQKLNLDPALVPVILKKPRDDMYLLDTVEKSVRFSIPVMTPGYMPKKISPSMARNYCQYLIADRDKMLVSDRFSAPHERSIIINRIAPVSSVGATDAVVFQERSTKVQTAAGLLDKKVLLLPMERTNHEESTFAQTCVVEWYVWPDRAWDDPAKIIFSACILETGLHDSVDGPIKPEKMFPLIWADYSKLNKNANFFDRCKAGLTSLGEYFSNGMIERTTLFAPPDASLSAISQTLRTMEATQNVSSGFPIEALSPAERKRIDARTAGGDKSKRKQMRDEGE